MKTTIPLDRRVKWYSSTVKHYEKVVDGKPQFAVLGYFTSDNPDQIGDIITKDATKKAIQKYRRIGNVRYMHQPEPVGKVLRIGEEDGLEWNQTEIKIVDPKTQNLIREGVLCALSVGIIVNDAEPVDGKDDDPFWFMSGGMRITDYDMVEQSVCDHPMNLDAMLTDYPGAVSAQQRAYIFKSVDLDNLIDKTKDGSSEVQTLILSKDVFKTAEEATKWVRDHDFTVKEGAPDETENSWRFRQFDPDECDEDTYGTKPMTEGVQAVYCVKKQGKSVIPTDRKDMDALIPDNMTNISEQEEPEEEKSHNELPDAAFAFIESGGEKDDGGKTTPRNLRHLPHHTSACTDGADNSTVDKPLLRNAYARVNQVKPVTDMSKDELVSKCENHLERHRSVLDGDKTDSPNVDMEKSMEEKDKQEVIPAKDKKRVEPEKQEDDKMDKMLATLDKLLEAINKIVPKPVTINIENSAPATEQNSEPVQEAKVEPEVKAVEPDVVKAETAKDDVSKTVEASVEKAFAGLEKRLDERDEVLKKYFVDYIEKLRSETNPGKAALVQPEEPVQEKRLSEKERQAALRKAIEDGLHPTN